MWDFGILNLRNNKPSEQWTPISDECPFGTMNLYFGTMNFRNNEPSEQWTPISDKLPFGPINLRHNKPFFRNNEPSEQWTFGKMNLRKNGPSEKRTVTVWRQQIAKWCVQIMLLLEWKVSQNKYLLSRPIWLSKLHRRYTVFKVMSMSRPTTYTGIRY